MNRVAGEICFIFAFCIRTQATRKLRKRCSWLSSWVSWRLNEVLQSGAHASSSVFDATSALKGSPCRKQHIHVYVEEEEWEVVCRFVIDAKETVTIIWHGHFLEIEVSRFSRPEASFLSFLFFMKTAMKLVVELPMTVDLRLIVAAMTDADTC